MYTEEELIDCEILDVLYNQNHILVNRIRRWPGDPRPYVEINSRHRHELARIQEEFGDKMGFIATVKA